MSRKGTPPARKTVTKIKSEQELDLWERFWFAPQTYQQLLLQRIGFGVLVLLVVANFWGNIDRWFGDTGLMSTNRLARIVTSTEVVEAARWRLSVINYLESPVALRSFLAIVAFCGTCMALGIGGRLAALGCWIGMLSIANSIWVVADTGWVVFCLALSVMVIAGVGDHPIWKRSVAPNTSATSWHGLAIRLTQVHLVGFLITYGASNLTTAWTSSNIWQIVLSITSLATIVGIVVSRRNRIYLVGLLVILLLIVGLYSEDYILSISLAVMSTVYIQPWSRASTTN